MAIFEPQASDPARRRASSGWAWWLFGMGFVALVASFALRLVDDRPIGVPDVTGPVGFLAIGVAGLAIARRKPENAVGWLYLGIWMAVGLIFAFGSEYGYCATVGQSGAPGGT